MAAEIMQEYKFPDEQKATGEPETVAEEKLDIQIVDDTPPEDRGREPLPKEMVEELEKDDLEEYSEKVKRRISQARKAFHDERRAKESATREREEALKFAQKTYEENQKLKQRLGAGEKIFIEEVTKATTSEIAAAKDALKRAYESGDAEKIAEAQEAMTDAKIKLKEYQRFRPSLQEPESRVQSTQQAQEPPQQVVDPKAEAWRKENSWFGSDEEMTALALGLHEKLVRSGVDPRSDDYYRQVNTTMRKRFPEYFEEAEPQTREKDNEEKPSPRKAANVVAPATRSSAPRQIRLTPSQVAIAKRLGLTNEAYAREMIKLENSNGR